MQNIKKHYKRKILITGGAGFIGFSLANFLCKKYPDYQISIVDNLSRNGSEFNFQSISLKNVEYIKLNVSELPFLDLGSFDFILHAASNASVSSGIKNIHELMNDNLISTVNVLELAKKSNSKVIFLSSSRVYAIDKINQLNFKEANSRFILSNVKFKGVSKLGVKENFPSGNIRSLYGCTKLSSENLIKEYSNLFDIEYLINRCGNISGPGQLGMQSQGVLTYWILGHMFNLNLYYSGYNASGKQVRDFLHIHDLVSAIDLQICNFDSFKNNTFNIGGGYENSLSLCELTELCVSLTGKKVDIGKRINTEKFDIPWFITDSQAFKSVSGWKSCKSVFDICESTFDWLKKNPDICKKLLK